MTQMGLDYMRHKETARHNVADESIRKRQTDISDKDATTRQYVASFKPQEVLATMQQSEASMKQADVAAGRLSLDSAYREREVRAKEDSAASQLEQARVAFMNHALNADYREREMLAKELDSAARSSQALAAEERNRIDHLATALKHLDPSIAAAEAAKALGYSEGQQTLAGLNAILTQFIPKISVRV
jgi:hypothetical protein